MCFAESNHFVHAMTMTAMNKRGAHKTKRQNDFYEFNFRVELAYLDCVDSNRWHDRALAVKSFVGHL